METNLNSPNGPKPEFAKRVFRWLLLLAGTLAIFGIAYELVMQLAIQAAQRPQSQTKWFVFFIAIILALAAALLFFPLAVRRVKWVTRLWESMFTWRSARRALIGLAVLATITAVIYTEENWRGIRAWEKCKRELEAKGEVLDWPAFVPPLIPDEQNIIKAPKMTEWFVKPKPGSGFSNELSAKLNMSALSESAKRNDARNPILVARLAVVPANFKATNGADVVIRFDAPGARERLGKPVRDAVGPNTIGSQDITFVLNPLSQIRPGRILLATDRLLSASDVSEILPASLISSNVGHLRIETDTGNVSFRIMLASKPTIAAGEYLAWSDKCEPEFNLIREALKRPHIRMDGDFDRPFEMPIVNFINIRNVAQTGAQRAQCCLLLGRSEQAFHELSLIFELRRLLAAKPTMLVSAMIDVAITGLYADVIADGLRLQAWREPELLALQGQLRQINLPPAVADSFRGERAAVCHTIEITTARDTRELWSFTDPNVSFWRKITNPMYLFFTIAPRGWLYQNMALIAPVEQIGIEIFSPTNRVIEPGRASSAVAEINRIHAHRSPYAVLAAIAVPNYSKATRTTARNQTKVNQAFIACALERYRLAHGQYPEALDVLVPQFADKLPHDIIGGQPLHYQRANEGKFLLYSIGWNETDDGGVEPPKNKSGNPDLEKGDWVWGQPAK